MGIGGLQPIHLIVILIVVLLIFGAGKLPEVGRAFGKSIKEFKSEVSNGDTPTATKTVETVTTNNVTPIVTNTVPAIEEPEVVRRTVRTLEDGSQEIVEERVVRKKVSN